MAGPLFLMSSGNASNCSLLSFAPRPFLCSCASSPPLCLSCTAATAGLLPACGDAAFRMWFLRKRWSVAGAGSSQRPKAPGGLSHQLCAHRATPGVSQHSRHGDIPPTTVLPLLLATGPASHGAGTELVGSLPEMNRVSSDLDVSLGWFSARLTQCLLEKSRQLQR